MFSFMTIVARTATILATALVVFACGRADPTLAGETKAVAGGAAVEGPGRGDLKGFVATPQTAGGNKAFLIAPNGSWFLATSPRASGARLIDISNGLTLRFLTSPGLHIAALSISPDSKTVSARDYDGRNVAWDAATGEPAPSIPTADFRDITKLWFSYEGNDVERRAPAELLTRYRLQVHFPQLKRFDGITLNPTKEYAIVGHVGDADWKSFEIWDLKNEKPAVFFRLASDTCGFDPSAFDYDGKNLVFGNSGGESEPNHLDFAIFGIAHFGPENEPKTAKATQILGDKCSVPPASDGGFEQDFSISPGGELMLRGGGMPGSPEWAAWDLRNGRKVASIHPDGYGIVSDDDRTIVVLHDLSREGASSRQSMTVKRGGKQKTFEIPRSMQSENWRPVILSLNAQWIASKVGGTVAVWSSDSGKILREYHVGDGKISHIVRLSDTGDPLLINDDEGTVFVKGAWRLARSDKSGLIVPLTPNFHAQCGAIFCDRVIAELGVVERKSLKGPLPGNLRRDLSADGRFMIVRLDTTASGVSGGIDIVDVADGHVVMHVPQDDVRFLSDGSHIVVRDADFGSFVKYEIATGKRLWTTFPNWRQDGFHMILPGGRIRYSPTQHIDFRLVRGFEIKSFDNVAAKQFIAPAAP
jgi:WD40 repeat protein